MFGAILGDIIGSPYEFDQGDKTKEFPLFSKKSFIHSTQSAVIFLTSNIMPSKFIYSNSIPPNYGFAKP